MGHHYDTEMDGCGRCMKYSLFIVNFIIFLAGITVTAISIYAIVEKVNVVSELTGSTMFIGVIYILLVGGIIATVISFFGCLGALREVRCLLFLYFIIIFMLFVVVLIGGILAYVFRDKFVDTMQPKMRHLLELYGESPEAREIWDSVQSNLECCGIESWHDWNKYQPNHQIPLSCCRKMADGQPMICNRYTDSINQYSAYTHGCLPRVKEYIKKHANILGCTGLVVAFLMLLGMIFSCALFKSIH